MQPMFLLDVEQNPQPGPHRELAAVAVLLLVVAVVSSVLRARRATRIQAVDALRDV